MRSLICILVLAGTCVWSNAYNYQQSNYFQQQSSGLSSWANENMDVVQKLADQLKRVFYAKSRGQDDTFFYYINNAWNENFAELIGKSTAEVNALTQKLCDQIIADILSGRLSYEQISQPHYFEAKAASALENLDENPDTVKTQDIEVEPELPLVEPAVEQNYFNDVKQNYPTAGHTLITSKNWNTEVNPIVYKNPTYATVPFNPLEQSVYRQNPTISNNSPQMRVYNDLSYGMDQSNALYNPFVFPFNAGDMFKPNKYEIHSPGQIVTVKNVDRKFITGPDGIPLVSGSESKSVWNNGNLVYNNKTTFGTSDSTMNDMWKREERGKLFWLLQDRKVNRQELEKWQTKEEDRLLGLSFRSKITLEEIKEWQRQEVDRYNAAVLNQHNTGNSNLLDWQRREQGRIDWLIQQNNMTKEDLEHWLNDYNQKLIHLAQEYQITVEELKAYYYLRQDFNGLRTMINRTAIDSGKSVSQENRFPYSLEPTIFWPKPTPPINYSPIDRVDNDLNSGINHRIALHTPLSGVPYEGISPSIVNQYETGPSHTVTVKKINRKVNTGPDGIPLVSGSESEYVWNNGNLVYNNKTTFGTSNSTMNDMWKREERGKLFWLLQDRKVNSQELEKWQTKEEDRLFGLSFRSKITLEEIKEWQRKELDRYNAAVLNQSGAGNSNLLDWQRREQSRIDWLIQQNNMTKEDLERWMYDYSQKLILLAQEYQVPIEELKIYYRQELNNHHAGSNYQNTQTISDCLNNTNALQKQHNDTVNELNSILTYLREQIQNDQEKYKSLVQKNQFLMEQEAFFKNESERLTKVINEQQAEMKKLAEKNKTLIPINEKDKLKKLNEGDELEKTVKEDRNRIIQLAAEYNVTSEEIADYIKAQGERTNKSLLHPSEENLNPWQQHEREYLMALVQSKHLTKKTNFEDRLYDDLMRMENVAFRFQTTVVDIVEFWRKEYQRLIKMNIISEGEDDLETEQWHQREQIYIQNLLQQRTWSIDELEGKLKNDENRLQRLAIHYNVTVKELKEFYQTELQKLLQEKKLYSENLRDLQNLKTASLGVEVDANAVSEKNVITYI